MAPSHPAPPTLLPPVGAGGRLTFTVARYLTLAGDSRPRRALPADAIAQSIREHSGDVWPAILKYGVSYGHALRIRNGWRPRGKRAEPMYWDHSRNVGRRTPPWWQPAAG